jgi:sec-independent protein translocase protein TatB
MTTPPTIEFASLGMWESLILMVMALVVFGPRRLPEIGRQIGRLMYEARKLSNEFKFQMEEELRKAEEAGRRKTEEQRLAAAAQAGGTSEAVYPAARAAAPEPTAEGSYPRILPPSPGEPVAATRPGGLAASAQTAGTVEAVSQVSESRPGAPGGAGEVPVSAGEVPVEARAEADKTTPATDEAHHG